MKNEGYVKSFGGDVEGSKKLLGEYEEAWKKGGQVGNLPLATLLHIALTQEVHTPKAKKPKKVADV